MNTENLSFKHYVQRLIKIDRISLVYIQGRQAMEWVVETIKEETQTLSKTAEQQLHSLSKNTEEQLQQLSRAAEEQLKGSFSSRPQGL